MFEWISIKDDFPPGPYGIVKVRRKNGDEIKAFYHADAVAWVKFYGVETSKFQCYDTYNFLFDVTHWRPLRVK
jgi:hypothetical protein